MLISDPCSLRDTFSLIQKQPWLILISYPSEVIKSKWDGCDYSLASDPGYATTRSLDYDPLSSPRTSRWIATTVDWKVAWVEKVWASLVESYAFTRYFSNNWNPPLPRCFHNKCLAIKKHLSYSITLTLTMCGASKVALRYSSKLTEEMRKQQASCCADAARMTGRLLVNAVNKAGLGTGGAWEWAASHNYDVSTVRRNHTPCNNLHELMPL